jgi:hypothetical protein
MNQNSQKPQGISQAPAPEGMGTDVSNHRKLLVSVLQLRNAGRAIPRYQHAFPKPFTGVLTAGEEHVTALNRRALVAVLRDPTTGAYVDGLPPLWDARVVRVSQDEMIWTGLEGALIAASEVVVAQAWRVQIVSIATCDPTAF